MVEISQDENLVFDQYTEIDMRNSYSSEHIILPAEGNLDMLTDPQTYVWNAFYPDGVKPGPLQKSDINPADIVKALPNIWMYDIIYDEAGQITELRYRLQGTKLDEIYGSAVDDRLILEDFKKEMALGRADEYMRTIAITLAMVKDNMPQIGLVKKLSGHQSHLSEHDLVFPVCYKSDRINIVLGHSDVLPAILE